MTQNWQAQYGRVGAFNARIEENVGGIRVVKAFANEAHERRLFAADKRAYRATKLDAYKIMAATRACRSTISACASSRSWCCSAAPPSWCGAISAPAASSASCSSSGCSTGRWRRSARGRDLSEGIAGFRRYRELLATAPDIVDRRARCPRRHAWRDPVRGVRFGYGDGRPVDGGVDLAVRAGETVAFVGPSGAGKTPCAPWCRGSTTSRPAHHHRRARHPRPDARLPAGPDRHRAAGRVLFAGTIRENIAYGRLDAGEAEIRERRTAPGSTP